MSIAPTSRSSTGSTHGPSLPAAAEGNTAGAPQPGSPEGGGNGATGANLRQAPPRRGAFLRPLRNSAETHLSITAWSEDVIQPAEGSAPEGQRPEGTSFSGLEGAPPQTRHSPATSAQLRHRLTASAAAEALQVQVVDPQQALAEAIDTMATNLHPGNRAALQAMLEGEGVTSDDLHGLAGTAAVVDKLRSVTQGAVVAGGFALGNVANFAPKYAANKWVQFGLAPGALVAAAAVNYLSTALPRIGPKHNPLVAAGTARLPHLSVASDHSADKALHHDPFYTFSTAYVLTDAVADILKVDPGVRLAARAVTGIMAGAARSLKAYERSNSYRTDQGNNNRQAWLNANDIEGTRAKIGELKRGAVHGVIDMVGEGLHDVVDRGLLAIMTTLKSPKTLGIAGSLALTYPATLLARASGVSDRFDEVSASAGRQVGNGLLIPAYNTRFYMEALAEKLLKTNHKEVLQKAFGQPQPVSDTQPPSASHPPSSLQSEISPTTSRV